MKALITNDIAKVEFDFSRIAEASAGDPGMLRIFSLTSDLAAFPTNRHMTGNIFYCHPLQVFDEVFVGPSVRLFPNSWGRSFVRHAARMCRPGGRLVIPFAPPGRDLGGEMPLHTLVDLLAEPQTVKKESRLACFLVEDEVCTVKSDSILDWGARSFADLVLFDVLIRASPVYAQACRADLLNFEFLHDADRDIVDDAKERLDASNLERRRYAGAVAWADEPISLALGPELARAVKSQSYYLAGIGYKSALFEHIIREHFGDRSPSHLIDFGGGYGLLAAEMCLNKALGLSSGFVRDIAPLNFLLAGTMYRNLRERLRDRFRFSLGAAEDLDLPGRFSVISFVGSLLYVPTGQRAPTLARCWESLEPGGIIIVHENIKNPAFKADYNVMFTVEELDGLLTRFGPIRRYMSTSAREITQEHAEAKTVFRVVTKSA